MESVGSGVGWTLDGIGWAGSLTLKGTPLVMHFHAHMHTIFFVRHITAQAFSVTC